MERAKNLIHSFESNPYTQLRFHTIMASVWIGAMIAIPFFPALYGHGVAPLIIEEVSLYANFATEYGSMSAAIAAQKEK